MMSKSLSNPTANRILVNFQQFGLTHFVVNRRSVPTSETKRFSLFILMRIFAILITQATARIEAVRRIDWSKNDGARICHKSCARYSAACDETVKRAYDEVAYSFAWAIDMKMTSMARILNDFAGKCSEGFFFSIFSAAPNDRRESIATDTTIWRIAERQVLVEVQITFQTVHRITGQLRLVGVSKWVWAAVHKVCAITTVRFRYTERRRPWTLIKCAARLPHFARNSNYGESSETLTRYKKHAAHAYVIHIRTVHWDRRNRTFRVRSRPRHRVE